MGSGLPPPPPLFRTSLFSLFFSVLIARLMCCYYLLGVDVKLNVFHAVQRISKTLSRANPISNAFLKEFTQIFRRDDDQGPIRTKNTPDQKQLENNLNSFIERWVNVPNGPLGNLNTAKEIESLRLHIQKGCLSNIPPGCGTEKNKQLHRLLNRSLITGATKMSVELAIALLTILFYYHSSKSSASHHECSSRVVPVVPINGMDNLKKDVNHQAYLKVLNDADKYLTRESSGDSSCEPKLGPEVTVAETITDMCTDYVAGSILNVALNLKEIINNVDSQSCNRAFDSSSVLHLSKLSNLLSLDDDTAVYDPNINTHIEDLERHLCRFRLEIDSISRDGDCAFHSIVRQLLKLDFKGNNELECYLKSLNLLSESEEEDTFTLRQLFVKELIKGEDEYLEFLSAETTRTFAEMANEFRTSGVFDREIGDLTMKVCSDVLRIPIVIITSSRSTPVVPIVPDRSLSNTPLFIAFHYYGAGHYDATNNKCDQGMYMLNLILKLSFLCPTKTS